MRVCPNCNQVLEEIERQDGTKTFKCKNEGIEFCEHILDAQSLDRNSFACNNCASPIEECDCYDCEVFCEKCNSFIFCSCCDVEMCISYNEEHLKNQRRLDEVKGES